MISQISCISKLFAKVLDCFKEIFKKCFSLGLFEGQSPENCTFSDYRAHYLYIQGEVFTFPTSHLGVES